MTIAAGIVCTDGIVICSDTQITEGNSKFDRSKIWRKGDDLVVTGSGTSDYLKMAFDKLSASLDASCPDNPAIARDEIEVLIHGIYERHILPFSQAGHYVANELSLSLIVGVRCLNKELALIKTTLTGATLSDDYECTGSGTDVFKYWAEYFFQRKMSMELAGYLCLFMVREAKMAVPGVGGSTHIHKLSSDPAKTRKRFTLWDDKEVLAKFPVSTIEILMACVDSRMQDAEFESRISDYIHRFRSLRHTLKQRSIETLTGNNLLTATAVAAVKLDLDSEEG